MAWLGYGMGNTVSIGSGSVADPSWDLTFGLMLYGFGSLDGRAALLGRLMEVGIEFTQCLTTSFLEELGCSEWVLHGDRCSE